MLFSTTPIIHPSPYKYNGASLKWTVVLKVLWFNIGYGWQLVITEVNEHHVQPILLDFAMMAPVREKYHLLAATHEDNGNRWGRTRSTGNHMPGGDKEVLGVFTLVYDITHNGVHASCTTQLTQPILSSLCLVMISLWDIHTRQRGYCHLPTSEGKQFVMTLWCIPIW